MDGISRILTNQVAWAGSTLCNTIAVEWVDGDVHGGNVPACMSVMLPQATISQTSNNCVEGTDIAGVRESVVALRYYQRMRIEAVFDLASR